MKKSDNDSVIEHIALNQCPYCMGELVLVEEERSITQLNARGIPKTQSILNDITTEVKLVCCDCGKDYDAEKEGMHYIIKRTLPKIKREKRIKDFNPFYTK